MDQDQSINYEANRRHDQAHPEFIRAPGRINLSWRGDIRGKRLTDKRIRHYQKLGYYSADFKAARRELMARRNRPRREGNFILAENGSLIYSPSAG